MANGAATTGLLISLGFMGALGGRSCSKDDTTEKFNVGDCVRETDLLNMDNRMGYFHFVVDKTPEKYVMCQGQYVDNDDSIFHKRWYGCDLKPLTWHYNETYSKVTCPDWTVDQKNSPYNGRESK